MTHAILMAPFEVTPPFGLFPTCFISRSAMLNANRSIPKTSYTDFSCTNTLNRLINNSIPKTSFRLFSTSLARAYLFIRHVSLSHTWKLIDRLIYLLWVKQNIISTVILVFFFFYLSFENCYFHVEYICTDWTVKIANVQILIVLR